MVDIKINNNKWALTQDVQRILYLKIGPKWYIMCLLDGFKHLYNSAALQYKLEMSRNRYVENWGGKIG